MDSLRRFSEDFVNRLLDDEETMLGEFTSIICSTGRFDPKAPDYGLPPFAFAFAEGLLWLSQSVRSGAWTYYEATPIERQRAALDAFRWYLGFDLSEYYERGMRDWQDEFLMERVDQWMRAHDCDINRRLRHLLRENRNGVIELAA